MLRGVARDGGVRFPEKKLMKSVSCTQYCSTLLLLVLALRRGGWGSTFLKKALRNTWMAFSQVDSFGFYI